MVLTHLYRLSAADRRDYRNLRTLAKCQVQVCVLGIHSIHHMIEDGFQRWIRFNQLCSQIRDGGRLRKIDTNYFGSNQVAYDREQFHLDIHVTINSPLRAVNMDSNSGIAPYDNAISLRGCIVGFEVPCSI